MADTDRRIVVEGVEFAQLVRFPRIVRAITAAFQPQRLVVALTMVAALVTAGRGWDAVFTPSVAPGGVLAAPWTEQDTVASREVLLAALNAYLPQEARTDAPLDAREVQARVQQAYARQREALVDASGDEAGRAALRQADETFLRTVEEIDRVRPRGIFEATLHHVVTAFNRAVQGLIYLRFDDFYQGLADLFVRTPVALWRQDSLFTVLYGLLLVLVMAMGGGAISRMAAVELARNEKMSLHDGVDFALSNWRRLVFSLLLPLLIAGLLSAALLLVFFVLMLPWLDVLGGLLYGVGLLMGFGVVFLLAGYAAGCSLLVPAVACERCDEADALQRAYAYVLGRPLHLLGYGLVACASLAVGYVAASLLAVGVLNVTGAVVDAATANAVVKVSHGFALFDLAPRRASALPMAMHSQWSAGLVMLWQTVVVCLVAAYVLSHYFSASTTVYMLMRRASDGQELDEIWEPEPQPGSVEQTEAPDEIEDEDLR